jgi:hypothetical protein
MYALEHAADLRTWCGDSTLVWWIQRELEKLKQAGSALGRGEVGDHSISTTGMLCLVSFALASRIFGGAEIASACRSESIFLRLCDGRFPLAQEVSGFRQANFRLLQQVLTGVFVQAVMSKFGLHSTLLPPQLHEDLRVHAIERLELAGLADAVCTARNGA